MTCCLSPSIHSTTWQQHNKDLHKLGIEFIELTNTASQSLFGSLRNFLCLKSSRSQLFTKHREIHFKKREVEDFSVKTNQMQWIKIETESKVQNDKGTVKLKSKKIEFFR
jgi:hypothetical protein